MTGDKDLFRQAMASFATGVTLVTVDYAGAVKGMTANAFASVSLQPLLVLVCVDHKADTHAYLHARKRFGINILAAQQRAISVHYANPDRETLTMEPGSEAKFDRTQHGTPVLHGALAYLECRLQDARDAGDHTIFIAEVEDLVVRSGEPLLYFRRKYHALGPEVT
ncbi:MAG TPA: flavin reductase family protein [Terriglobales bacterium]